MGKGLQLLAYTLVIRRNINKSEKHINQHLTKFDTDSDKIGINNRHSAFILHKIDNFISPLKDVNISINGFEVKEYIISKWVQCNGRGVIIMENNVPFSYPTPTIPQTEK